MPRLTTRAEFYNVIRYSDYEALDSSIGRPLSIVEPGDVGGHRNRRRAVACRQ